MTLTSIFLIVPPSLINNSSVVASPDVRADCPEITLSFMCSLSTALSAILASVMASSTIDAVTTALAASWSAPTASSAIFASVSYTHLTLPTKA